MQCSLNGSPLKLTTNCQLQYFDKLLSTALCNVRIYYLNLATVVTRKLKYDRLFTYFLISEPMICGKFQQSIQIDALPVFS